MFCDHKRCTEMENFQSNKTVKNKLVKDKLYFFHVQLSQLHNYPKHTIRNRNRQIWKKTFLKRNFRIHFYM